METQVPKPHTAYTLSHNPTDRYILKAERIINAVLDFLSLRKHTQFWGMVYDSVSKQPLDPAIVKLLYVDTNHVQTAVTDLKGRYGFLARPGKFKIIAKKTNYTFPSKRVTGDKDGVLKNLYHGEFFELYGNEDEVIGPNIPMDPEQVDWNQAEKTRMKITELHTEWNYYLLKIISVFFWFGLFFAGLDVWANFEHPALGLVFIFLYALIFALRIITPPVRLWGRIQGVTDFSDFLLELHEPQLPTMVFGKGEVRDDGKFFLRANPGKYELQVKSKSLGPAAGPLASCMVMVLSEGVVNDGLIMKQK